MRHYAESETSKLPPHKISPEYLDLDTARKWGLTPAEWRAQSSDDQARMTAQCHFQATYEGWAQAELLKQSRKESPATRSEPPENPTFAAMKARMKGRMPGVG